MDRRFDEGQEPASLAVYGSQALGEQIETPACCGIVSRRCFPFQQHGEQHQRNSLGTVGEGLHDGASPVLSVLGNAPSLPQVDAGRHNIHAYVEINQLTGVATLRRGRTARVPPNLRGRSGFGWVVPAFWGT